MYLNEFRDGHGTIRIRFLFENVTFNFLIAEYAPLLSSLRNVILITTSNNLYLKVYIRMTKFNLYSIVLNIFHEN